MKRLMMNVNKPVGIGAIETERPQPRPHQNLVKVISAREYMAIIPDGISDD